YYITYFFLTCYATPPTLPPFPTRRSSDLHQQGEPLEPVQAGGSERGQAQGGDQVQGGIGQQREPDVLGTGEGGLLVGPFRADPRSEEHTSELQSLAYLVCRLLLEKKKKKN